MQKRYVLRWCALCLTALIALPASAWGPDTQASIVMASGNIFAQRNKIPARQFQHYLKLGTRLTPEAEELLYPNYATHPANSIEQEIYLLQAIRSDRIDPYFAFRMGALAKKVVALATPMRHADPALRDAYYRDVDARISRANLSPKESTLIEPLYYFKTLAQTAAQNDRLISYDYKTDLGIRGVAGKSIDSDASRAVDAVGDVWHTVFNRSVQGTNLSRSNMRAYMIGAIDFYLRRHEIKEVGTMYALAESKGILTPAMRKKVGDLYYDNQRYEEALRIYHALLTINPGQRDVNQRIAAYHILMGDRANRAGQLEEARDAYHMAVLADAFGEEGSRKLTSMEITIEKREARNLAQHSLNVQAQQWIADADEEAYNRNYAGAIEALEKAQVAYTSVTSEFTELSHLKIRGTHTLRIKLAEMKKALVQHSQRLSGSGFSFDARRLATQSEDTAPGALHSILKTEYEAAVSTIEKDLATR